MLIDQVMPRWDFAIVHAAVFRAPPEESFRAARSLDVLRHPLVWTLVTARSLPRIGQRPRSLRIDDMLAPPLNWVRLGKNPGAELVLGQVSRPWAGDVPADQPRTADRFAAFDRPGFAKIVFSLGSLPYGAGSSILVFETRVALTDDESLRRFRRYWRFVRPMSDLIRRNVVRRLTTHLHGAPSFP